MNIHIQYKSNSLKKNGDEGVTIAKMAMKAMRTKRMAEESPPPP